MIRPDDDTAPKRRIRSFVRRPGRVTAGQRRALAELWPRYAIGADAGELDLDRLFDRHAAERVLEIGYGDGEGLLALARDHPEADFIGVEIHRPGIGHCLLGIESLGLTNIRLIAIDALEVMEHMLAPGSLARINLYFPDPWPKKRHHKRRIVNDRFSTLAARCLEPGGTLHIATDWASYAEQIEATFAASTVFVRKAHRRHRGNEPIDRPTTKFERRGLRLGHSIHDWVFERV